MKTEEDYIEQSLTRWDYFRGNAFFIPVGILFVGIMCGLLEIITTESMAMRICVTAFVITFAISIVLRVGVMRKVARLKSEWRKINE